MPKSSNLADIDRSHPAYEAWRKYEAGRRGSDYAHEIFKRGWNAALDWLPVRIQQFREIEEGLRKEIEDLKRGNPPEE
jgi:hypothetical protein